MFRRTFLIIFATALVGGVCGSAFASATAPPPVVLLMWDGSGSMMLQDDGNVLNPGDCPGKPARLHVAQQVFTGTFNSPTCVKTPRVAPGLGPLPIWENYALDYYKMDGGGVPKQLEDGMIDKYRKDVKFAFMTTDAQTCGTNAALCGFSYGHSLGGVNMGARGPDAGTLLSGLLTVPLSDAENDIVTNNIEVQRRILNLVPFGSTPLTAFFEDALWFFKNDPNVKEYDGLKGDQFWPCRLKRIIMITDGVETVVRGSNRTAVEVVTELYNMGIITYIVGYALSSEEQNVSQLTALAKAGQGKDDVDFYQANNSLELKRALSTIMVDIQGSLRSFGTPLVTSRTGNLKDLQFECYYGDRKNLYSPFDRSGEVQCIAYRCTCPPPAGEPDDGTVQPCETYNLTDNYHDKMLSGWSPRVFTPLREIGTRGLSSLNQGSTKLNDMKEIDINSDSLLKEGEEYRDSLLNLVPLVGGLLSGLLGTDPCTDISQWENGVVVGDTESKSGDETNTPPTVSWTEVKPIGGEPEYQDWDACKVKKAALWKEIIGHSDSRRWPDTYAPVSHADIVEPPNADINNASFTIFKEQRTNDPTMMYTLTGDGTVRAHKLSWTGGQSKDFGPVIWTYVPGCLQPYLRKFHEGGDINLQGGKFKVRHVRFKVKESTLIASNGIANVATNWRTMMVGCTGSVSQCCFALDITNPNEFYVRWETRPGRRCWLKEAGVDDDPSDDVWTCFESPIDWENDSPDVIARKFGEFGSMTVQPEIGQIFQVKDEKSFTQSVVVIPSGYALQRKNAADVDVRMGGRGVYVLELKTGHLMKVLLSYFPDSTATTRVPFDADLTGTPIGYNTFTDTVMTRLFFGDAKGRVFRLGVASFDPTTSSDATADSVDNWSVRKMFDAFWDPADVTWQFALNDIRRRPINHAPALTIRSRGLLTVIGGTGNLTTAGYFPYKNVIFSFSEKLIPNDSGLATLSTEENWRYKMELGEMLTFSPIVWNSVAYWTTYKPNIGTVACDVGRGRLYGAHYFLTDPDDDLPLGKLTDATIGSENRFLNLPNTRPTGPKVVTRPTCFDDVDYNDTTGGKLSGVKLSGAKTGKTQIVVGSGVGDQQGTGTKFGGTGNKKMFTLKRQTTTGTKPKNKLVIQTGWSLLIL